MYCKYDEQVLQTPENLLASVWMQLIHNHSSVSDKVRDIYKAHINKDTRPRLKDIVESLTPELAKFNKVYLFLDALDECADESRRDTLLDQLRNLRPKVNLMVTSRYLDSIANILEGSAKVDIEASSEDLRKYVTGRIIRGSRLSRHARADETLAKDIEERVVNRADGMCVPYLYNMTFYH